MKFYILIFVSFIGHIIVGQETIIRVENFSDYSLELINDSPHFFVDDSVYVVDGSDVKSYQTNRYDIKNLIHVKDTIYKHAGGGSLYYLNSDYQIERFSHKPKMEQSFFQSLTFVRNDTIIQFGGYGNFSHKNDLIYFDKKLKSWEFYPYNNKNETKPPLGSPQFFSYSDDILKIIGFYGESPVGKQNDHELIQEIYEFSFLTKKWSKIGIYDFSNIFLDKVSNYYKTGNKYFAKSDFENTLLVDFDDMKWGEYQDLVSINNKFRGLKKINNTYYVLNLNSGNSIELFRIRRENFLGRLLRSDNILIDDTFNIYYLVIILVLFSSVIIGFIVYKRRKASSFEVLIRFRESNQVYLSTYELRLLDEILNKYPKSVSFKNIGGYFDNDLNFETKKVKTRKLIDQLNYKISDKINQSDLIKIRKNSDDKRAREVYLRNFNF